jgi:Peptidase family M50
MFTELRIPAGKRPMTRSEQRIAIAVGAAFTALILAAILQEFSVRKLSIVFMLVFWVLMLVLHELGHAVVARLLGWRVREIVIGFGRELWQWQIGETRLRVKLAPVEGYVLPAPVNAERVRLKSALFYAAGPGAELLLLGIVLLVFGWDAVFGPSVTMLEIALKSLAVVIIIGAGFNLLPFRTDGAVSDGLGILSSPFTSRQAIELRLLTFEMREVQERLLDGDTAGALRLVHACRDRFPDDVALHALHALVLSADGQVERARELARDILDGAGLSDADRLAWLQVQAQVELDADPPSFLVLDRALQQADRLAPGSQELLALRGASLVRRGRDEEGGSLLAEAWRQNDGSANEPTLLAYLSIAAHRVGDAAAARHFHEAFQAANGDPRLARLVQRLTGG